MLDFGREVTGDLNIAKSREWLVTNGIGGYASGTIPGILTRHYHGVLVAALEPPLGRTVLLSKIDETVTYAGITYELFANHWENASTSITDRGWANLQRFYLDGTLPVWEYDMGDAILEKRLWMAIGENTTYVRYTLLRGSAPIHLSAKIIGNHRSFHSGTRSLDWQMTLSDLPDGLKVDAFYEATPYFIRNPDAQFTHRHHWYKGYFHNAEHYRGLTAIGDHLHLTDMSITLQPGESSTVVFSTLEAASIEGEASLSERRRYEQKRLAQAGLHQEPQWIQQLVLAADQFIVRRNAGDNPDGRSILAGYHWFGDWGRDTMISLPGLTLCTGRTAEAAMILRTFARFMDKGMLPNRFPDDDETPEYNTVDATLWYFEAVRQYMATTGDEELLRDLYPVLQEIIAWHRQGTRYNIYMDPEDGLLFAGEHGVQLTWMDAKVGDWVVTPRIGKAIEINALWYNALRTMASFAQQLGISQEYTAIADLTAANFQSFWNEAAGFCYDVIDTPDGTNEAFLRPNQLLAVSLHYSALTPAQQKAVVDVCARHLLTAHGLRSLAPFEHGYTGVYGGNDVKRDGSYHQGTVWAWLIGAFVEAHLRVYGNPRAARDYLMPFAYHLQQNGLGTLSEIFDGDAPYTPRGAIAQAWSVAEVLRAWLLTR